jgi:hypothetical protein
MLASWSKDRPSGSWLQEIEGHEDVSRNAQVVQSVRSGARWKRTPLASGYGRQPSNFNRLHAPKLGTSCAWFTIMNRMLLGALPLLVAGLLPALGACAVETDEETSDDDLIALNQPVMSKARLDAIVRRDNIRSLDRLPASLPKDYLINFTLKHGKLRTGERGHLVERDVSQSSDPLAPRTILWDERSGFTLSYNGGVPGQTEGQRLDVHEFDEATKTFRLSGLEFNGTAPPVYKTDAQIAEPSRKCARCHGPGARPIFSMYPDWPSFYGSDNDELTNNSREVQRTEAVDYAQFRSLVATKRLPRYLSLFDPSNVPAQLRGTQLYPTFPYRPNHSEVGDDPSRAFAFRPSLRLGILMNRLMARAAMEQVKKHPRYAELRGVLLHDLLQCRWPSESAYKAIPTASVVQRVLGRAPRMVANGRTMHYRDLLKLFDLEVRDIDIRYSYNHQGYASDDASTNVMGTGYMADGYWNSYFDGSATIDELLAMALFKDLSADPNYAGIRNTITNPDGLVIKYERRTERFKFDANFFRQMDAFGMWIPIPYPQAILNDKHHREGYPSRYATQHQNLCRALETGLRSTSGGGAAASVTAGSACAPGCVYSKVCTASNQSARRYTAGDGSQVVCVQSGACTSECAPR